MPLTTKQENFCMKYMETGNASEAYRQAYDCTKTKNATVANNAYMLLKDSEITARLEELQTGIQAAFNYTVADALNELNEAIDTARNNGQASAMVSAIKTKIDMFGLNAPKKHDGNVSLGVGDSLREWLEGLQSGGGGGTEIQ